MHSLAMRMHRLVKKIDRRQRGRLEEDESRPASSEYSAIAALAKMAGKKKAQDSVSLQIEVETDGQWTSLLTREGLIVVDVYASWAGPCTSMISILKRVKIEINDERLWLAIACSDNINDLVVFKDQSEPTWLFIGGGRPVKLFRGSNAPKLVSLIKSEFENELKCMEGKAKRSLISINDEMSRRRKAETEAQRLADIIKDQTAHNQDKRSLPKEYDDGLEQALKPFTVLVIQNFLLETGAVTEIRDYLAGEFKIEQERYVNLNDDGIRQLFHIPYHVPDPNAVPEVTVQKQSQESIEETVDEEHNSDRLEVEEVQKSRRGSTASTIIGTERSERSPSPAPPPAPSVKMLDVDLPDGLVGDTLVMLLESVEIRKKLDADESVEGNADEFIQRRVGSSDLQDAIANAPQSLHAVYGKGEYIAGVWCPRCYSDKRYVMINFFPRFVTEMLMPPPGEAPKYVVAIFTADKASFMSKELELHRKDVLADGVLSVPNDLVHEILRSRDFGERYLSTKETLEGKRVYAATVDEQNSELMYVIHSNGPIHLSLDSTFGRMESDRIFGQARASRWHNKPGDMSRLDNVVEKVMIKQNGDGRQGEKRKSMTSAPESSKPETKESRREEPSVEPQITAQSQPSPPEEPVKETSDSTPTITQSNNEEKPSENV